MFGIASAAQRFLSEGDMGHADGDTYADAALRWPHAYRAASEARGLADMVRREVATRLSAAGSRTRQPESWVDEGGREWEVSLPAVSHEWDDGGAAAVVLPYLADGSTVEDVLCRADRVLRKCWNAVGMRTAGINIDEADGTGFRFYSIGRRGDMTLVPLTHSAAYREARRFTPLRMAHYGWSNDLLVLRCGRAPIKMMSDAELLSVHEAADSANRTLAVARDAHAAVLIAGTPNCKRVANPDTREPMAEARRQTRRSGFDHAAITGRIAQLADGDTEAACWLSLQCRDITGPWSARGIAAHLGVDPNTLRREQPPKAAVSRIEQGEVRT